MGLDSQSHFRSNKVNWGPLLTIFPVIESDTSYKRCEIKIWSIELKKWTQNKSSVKKVRYTSIDLFKTESFITIWFHLDQYDTSWLNSISYGTLRFRIIYGDCKATYSICSVESFCINSESFRTINFFRKILLLIPSPFFLWPSSHFSR